MHETIRVRGARENNLKGIDVDIPKRKLTVFTGVSGSGKSSLVFGTIAAESQRLINETYTAFVQSFMPSLARPDVEVLEGLSASIVVDQERMGANARSTVGTATDAHTMLRIIFSRLGAPSAGPAGHFSFNLAEGMCPRCEGIGRVTDLDIDEVVDRTKSLNEGAITIPGYKVDGWMVRGYSDAPFLDGDKKIADFSEAELRDFLYKEPTKVNMPALNMNLTYEGLIPRIQKSILSKDPEAVQPAIRAFMDRAVTFTACPECRGARLNEAALASRIQGRNIADCSAMQISDLAAFMKGVQDRQVAPVIATLQETLDSLVNIGLGYLSLDRESGSLSGGEAQRVKMVRHLGSSLTDVTYVFDEPTVGLHPHDIQRMNELLLRLRDKGNTVLVVEHKPETIAIADHVVDLGPRAGSDGGELQFAGTVEGLRASGTLTGKHLDDRVSLKEEPRSSKTSLEIRGATRHNLKDVDVDIPLGVLTVVTGVAGSGKSSLIHGSIPKSANVVVVDQTAIRGSRRSTPATYTGVLDAIRAAFAKANGVKPGLFSANSSGACQKCNGLGVIFTDLAMMAAVSTVCEECEGKRFQAEVLAYTLDGKNISEVLSMSIAEAHEFFATGPANKVLGRLVDVGLGYLGLGQPLTTLSGGERQRLKLAIHMAEKGGVYVLDEPTTGLHLADVRQLLSLLDRLVDSGKSVIVIEHHQAVMAHADWIIDIGPGAGHDGGSVVFEGTPAQLVADSSTLTGKHLASYVGA
ncbi:daunorubicin resistance protein DrrC [Pseudoclavibacter sp. RFBJ3]|uniref:ATP-binding cassette domain-containing protein n=1 Tax=unclassified Pseudoclavibacter TaxID=2615177 RepID=UPI000CE72521|nr:MULTISPECIES: excinuclease ABC subunit UvrA [unclassified Pseudoclavibacter]PPF84458.1 daunorubicin resistance protein DrrC [Pseudoclavibacter sp. RFBJ5]PPF92930.1 daunorubicin resistance protein DrrC [Pseudoclavibacter sp. RFBJ3]PPF98286.1 daunorubicin resistance protein DrrC [Pseudoclavibacter sp. RFBH5]PPG25356.1 daunorubicin resistance protein DrrC [Pseudoclavibacter sp. RFBI4]